MKIIYTQFAADPALRGTTTHLPAHIAQVLVAQGVAREIKYANYIERLQSLQDAMPPAKPPVVEWGVQDGLSQYSRPTIIRRCGSDTAFFAAPPADCPTAIVEQFRQLTDGSQFELSPEEAKMHAAAAYVGDSNKHRPVLIGHNKKTGEPLYRNPEDFVKR